MTKQEIRNIAQAITGLLSNLTTIDKTNLVAAINELKASGGGATIDDTAPSLTKVYSSQKTQNGLDTLQQEINAITQVGNKLFNYYNF